MMMYAWDLWPKNKSIESGHLKSAIAPLDRLGHVLAACIHKAEKSGLHRTYVERCEETYSPRGKIDLNGTARLRAVNDRRVVIWNDEYSIECVENIALAQAVDNLLKANLEKETRNRLLLARSKLESILTTEKLSEREISNAITSARRQEYKLALSIALMLRRSRLFDDKIGKVSHEKADVNDEALFRRLYEKFLRQYYKFNLPDRSVTGHVYRWSELPIEHLPSMQTDINIESAAEILIIDAKCTPHALLARSDLGGKAVFNSSHLYQIHTYMTYAKANNPTKLVTGALIYPQYSYAIDIQVPTAAGTIRIKTVDFMRDWGEVEQQLGEVVLPSQMI